MSGKERVEEVKASFWGGGEGKLTGRECTSKRRLSLFLLSRAVSCI